MVELGTVMDFCRHLVLDIGLCPDEFFVFLGFVYLIVEKMLGFGYLVLIMNYFTIIIGRQDRNLGEGCRCLSRGLLAFTFRQALREEER